MKHNRAGYTHGCRCKICVEANRKYQREYIKRRVKAGLADHHGRRIRYPFANDVFP